MAMLVGRPVQKVSIIPNKTRLGACEMKKGRFQPSNDWLEDEVLILLAGVVAEARITGRYNWQAAGQDLRSVRRLTRSRAGDETRAEKLERRLLAKTEHLLSDDGPRPHINLDRWRPLIMSFCRFFGIGAEVYPSRLAGSKFMTSPAVVVKQANERPN